VLLRIPIEVRGTNPDGKPFRERTTTLVINRHGARISLKTPVRPQDQITIANLQNGMSCPFRVVGDRDQSLGEGPECGVECLNPEVHFWGILFPEKVETPARKDVITALLECSACHFQELAQLTLEQYRSAMTHSSLRRDCPQCSKVTEWKFGVAQAEPDEVRSRQAGAAVLSSVRESWRKQRRAKRLTIKLPARIRLQDGREEVAQTENLSKIGACFVSDVAMEEGQRILVSVGEASGMSQPGVQARVVWRRPAEGKSRIVYGVELEESDRGLSFAKITSA